MGITKIYLNNKKVIDELKSYKFSVYPDSINDHAADAMRYFFISGYQPKKKSIVGRVVKAVLLVLLVALIIIYALFSADILNLETFM